jgi:hypothetical protein
MRGGSFAHVAEFVLFLAGGMAWFNKAIFAIKKSFEDTFDSATLGNSYFVLIHQPTIISVSCIPKPNLLYLPLVADPSSVLPKERHNIPTTLLLPALPSSSTSSSFSLRLRLPL